MEPSKAEPQERTKALSRKERLHAGEIEKRRPGDDRELGIFMPHLIAFAAGRNGVMVTGYHRDGGGFPAG